MNGTPTERARSSGPASTAGKRRIALVEDHPITRQGMKALIDHERDLVVCAEAGTAVEAVALVQNHRPDCALIDVNLPASSGIELVKQLRALRPEMPILVMSMHDETLFAERALRAGARGYIMKLETPQRMLLALRRVLEGEVFLSDKMKSKMLQRVAHSSTPEVVFSIDTLSAREMEVFQQIGSGYGTRQIAEKLNLSVKTIDSYREHLKLKLRLENGTELVRHAIQWMKSEAMG